MKPNLFIRITAVLLIPYQLFSAEFSGLRTEQQSLPVLSDFVFRTQALALNPIASVHDPFNREAADLAEKMARANPYVNLASLLAFELRNRIQSHLLITHRRQQGLIVSMDGPSGALKTTLANIVTEAFHRLEYSPRIWVIDLDAFMKEQLYRIAVRKRVIGKPLTPEERAVIPDSEFNEIQPGGLYLSEERLWRNEDIEEKLKGIREFFDQKGPSDEIHPVTIRAWLPQQKRYEEQTLSIRRGDVVLVAGKYANLESLIPYYDSRMRLLDYPAAVEKRFMDRSDPNLHTEDDLETYWRWYRLALVPSWIAYHERTQNFINGRISLSGRDPEEEDADWSFDNYPSNAGRSLASLPRRVTLRTLRPGDDARILLRATTLGELVARLCEDFPGLQQDLFIDHENAQPRRFRKWVRFMMEETGEWLDPSNLSPWFTLLLSQGWHVVVAPLIQGTKIRPDPTSADDDALEKGPLAAEVHPGPGSANKKPLATGGVSTWLARVLIKNSDEPRNYEKVRHLAVKIAWWWETIVFLGVPFMLKLLLDYKLSPYALYAPIWGAALLAAASFGWSVWSHREGYFTYEGLNHAELIYQPFERTGTRRKVVLRQIAKELLKIHWPFYAVLLVGHYNDIFFLPVFLGVATMFLAAWRHKVYNDRTRTHKGVPLLASGGEGPEEKQPAAAAGRSEAMAELSPEQKEFFILFESVTAQIRALTSLGASLAFNDPHDLPMITMVGPRDRSLDDQLRDLVELAGNLNIRRGMANHVSGAMECVLFPDDAFYRRLQEISHRKEAPPLTYLRAELERRLGIHLSDEDLDTLLEPGPIGNLKRVLQAVYEALKDVPSGISISVPPVAPRLDEEVVWPREIEELVEWTKDHMAGAPMREYYARRYLTRFFHFAATAYTEGPEGKSVKNGNVYRIVTSNGQFVIVSLDDHDRVESINIQMKGEEIGSIIPRLSLQPSPGNVEQDFAQPMLELLKSLPGFEPLSQTKPGVHQPPADSGKSHNLLAWDSLKAAGIGAVLMVGFMAASLDIPMDFWRQLVYAGWIVVAFHFLRSVIVGWAEAVIHGRPLMHGPGLIHTVNGWLEFNMQPNPEYCTEGERISLRIILNYPLRGVTMAVALVHEAVEKILSDALPKFLRRHFHNEFWAYALESAFYVALIIEGDFHRVLLASPAVFALFVPDLIRFLVRYRERHMDNRLAGAAAIVLVGILAISTASLVAWALYSIGHFVFSHIHFHQAILVGGLAAPASDRRQRTAA